jgi:hypothetical protein
VLVSAWSILSIQGTPLPMLCYYFTFAWAEIHEAQSTACSAPSPAVIFDRGIAAVPVAFAAQYTVM